jgi:protein-tyrosine phosphatase
MIAFLSWNPYKGFDFLQTHHVKVGLMMIDCNEVIPDRLWVGGYVRPEDISRLSQMGITAIVSMQSDQDLSNYNISLKKLLKACEAAEIEFRRIPTQDFDEKFLSATLPQAVAEVEKALAPRCARLYVHCTAGFNRGPTLAAAYLVKNQGLSAEDAHDYVSTRRHCSPYLSVLQQFEASLKNDRTG